MSKGLSGKRIVITASRKTDEMCTLIEKQGGLPLIRSLQGTVFLAEAEVEPSLRHYIQEGADWSIFTTGIGTETLVTIAQKLELEHDFLDVIKKSKVASRGYKTVAALKKIGVTPLAVDEDGTTRGLTRALEEVDFTNQKVMVQLHGETAPTLTRFLEKRGAEVLHILPYQHIPPVKDTVQKLCTEIISHEVDAVCFTTAIQVRSLFSYAKEQHCLEEVISSFKEQVLAVAVGKVTAEVLTEEGVERWLAPQNERMGAMIMELSHYYGQ